MGRIYIDTDELRRLASTMRDTNGEVVDLLGRLGGAVATTYMPLAPHLAARVAGQEAQVLVLAARVVNDANSITVEAYRVDLQETITEATCDVMDGVRWAIHGADTVWDWTTREVIGPLAGLGRGVLKVASNIHDALEAIPLVLVASVPGIGWFVNRIRRHLDYQVEVREPPDLKPPAPGVGWSEWTTKLERKTYGFDEYVDTIGSMPLGTIVVMKVSEPPARWVVLVRGISLTDPGRSLNTLENAELSVPIDWGPYEEAIQKAVVKAGVSKGDHLMFVGHSQGGITARNLASDRSFTHDYQVDGVLSVGSPVQHGFPPVDSRTHTVALNNMTDVVPNITNVPSLSTSLSLTDPLIQRGTEVDVVFHRGGLLAHDTDYYAAELRSYEGHGAAGNPAAMELSRPPFTQYSGRSPMTGGVHVLSALAPTSHSPV